MLGLLTPALVGSLLLAILSTAADYVWFLNIPQHQVTSGAIHGSTLFAALGPYLGWRKGKAGMAAIGFGVILFELYRGWPPATFPAFKHFIAWSMAYLPGLYVLLKRGRLPG